MISVLHKEKEKPLHEAITPIITVVCQPLAAIQARSRSLWQFSIPPKGCNFKYQDFFFFEGCPRYSHHFVRHWTTNHHRFKAASWPLLLLHRIFVSLNGSGVTGQDVVLSFMCFSQDNFFFVDALQLALIAIQCFLSF